MKQRCSLFEDINASIASTVLAPSQGRCSTRPPVLPEQGLLVQESTEKGAAAPGAPGSLTEPALEQGKEDFVKLHESRSEEASVVSLTAIRACPRPLRGFPAQPRLGHAPLATEAETDEPREPEEVCHDASAEVAPQAAEEPAGEGGVAPGEPRAGLGAPFDLLGASELPPSECVSLADPVPEALEAQDLGSASPEPPSEIVSLADSTLDASASALEAQDPGNPKAGIHGAAERHTTEMLCLREMASLLRSTGPAQGAPCSAKRPPPEPLPKQCQAGEAGGRARAKRPGKRGEELEVAPRVKSAEAEVQAKKHAAAQERARVRRELILASRELCKTEAKLESVDATIRSTKGAKDAQRRAPLRELKASRAATRH